MSPKIVRKKSEKSPAPPMSPPYSTLNPPPGPDAERHVKRHSPTLEEDREGVAFLHIAREPLEVGHRADGLAVELLDDVAALHAGLRGRGPVLHPVDDDPVGRSQIELSCDLGRHGTDLEPQHGARAAAAGALLLGGLTLVGRLAD